MVKFRIASVHIVGFRGAHDVTLSFDEGSPIVMIGPNNCGKSTLLDAVGLALGTPKFSRYIPSDDEFWVSGEGHRADEFTIDVVFAAIPGGQLPAVKGGIGDPIEVHGIRAVGTRDEPAFTRRLLNAAQDEILLNKGTPVSKAKQDDFKGMGLTGRRYATTRDIGQWLPEVWQLDSQSLFMSLYEWKSGPLQRLLGMYRDHLFADKWVTPSNQQMPDALDRVYKFLEDQALKTPFWKDVLAPGLTSKIKEYLGPQTSFEASPQLNPLESWLLEQLRLRITPGPKLSTVDSRKLGDGWQSLIRLAALELVVELGESGKGTILLMEEPETYLHPHLRRRLRTVLARLQGAGYQSIVATHSPELISFREGQQIVRLTMQSTGINLKTYPTASAGENLKCEEKLHERGNHEIVFAQAALLAEGKGDAFALRMGLKQRGVDCDLMGVSVVDCGSVSNIPDYARLLNALGIPWSAVHDRDIQADGSQKPNTAKARKELLTAAGSGACIMEWDNDLEDAIGYRTPERPEGKATPEWIDATYGERTWAEMTADVRVKQFTDLIEKVHASILQT